MFRLFSEMDNWILVTTLIVTPLSHVDGTPCIYKQALDLQNGVSLGHVIPPSYS